MLTKSQALLIHLIEECAEVQQRATKALRFGLDEIQPSKDKPRTNRYRLEEEIIDLSVIIELLQENLDIEDIDYSKEVIKARKEKINRYLKYSIELGEVEPENEL